MKYYGAVFFLNLFVTQNIMAADPEPFGRKTGLSTNDFANLTEFEIESGVFSECSIEKNSSGRDFTTCKVAGAKFKLNRAGLNQMQVRLAKLVYFKFDAQNEQDIIESYQLSGDWNERINNVEIQSRINVYVNRRTTGLSGVIKSISPQINSELIFSK